MFETLPENFRSFGLHADVRTLLILRKAIEKNLVRTIGDLHNVLKNIIVKEPRQIGPFTQAFYAYFLEIDIKQGQNLQDAILRSETFRQWRIKQEDQEILNDEELAVNTFLDEIHLSSYDIQKVIDGQEIWDKDNPNLADQDTQDENQTEAKKLDRMADYSKLSLEELLERMKQVAKNQKTKHSGGSHWIGTGGISPYGHGGAAKGGIRVAGAGGGKMARAVLGDKNYYPVDQDTLINDNSIDAALASLKGIVEESAQESLDIKETIKLGLKRGGLFIPEIRSVQQEKLQVLLFIDNGGYSMSAYVKIVQQLFKKMKTRFAHDLETFYFHNTIYDKVYADAKRTQPVSLKQILAKDPNYKIFIMGDASMADYELNQISIKTYQSLISKFKKTVWLNPEPEKYWAYTTTIQVIKKLIPMFPMTPRGVENAVKEINKKKSLSS